MAKGNQQQYQPKKQEPQLVEFTPEWMEANKERFKELGFNVVTKDEFEQQTKQVTAAAVAAKELLDLDIQTAPAVEEGAYGTKDVLNLIRKMADQIDLVMESTQYKNLMSQKERIGLYFVRVCLRQLMGEVAPDKGANTLAEVIGIHAKIPIGVLNDRGVATVPKKTKKMIRLNANHLEQAGITD